jgi:predicted DNA-binding transcriptional regulator AlpA
MTRPEDKRGNRRLVRYPQLKPEYGIPWSRAWIDKLVERKKFPRKVHLGPQTVGHWSDELDDFLASADADD